MFTFSAFLFTLALAAVLIGLAVLVRLLPITLIAGAFLVAYLAVVASSAAGNTVSRVRAAGGKIADAYQAAERLFVRTMDAIENKVIAFLEKVAQ